MPESTKTKPPEKTYSPELWSLLERGNTGDPSVLPALKKAFDDNPELAAKFGDLVSHAEQSLLSLAAGTNLTAKEAIARQVADLRQKLAATATSELEKLLIDRLSITWIEVYFSDMDLARNLLKQPNAIPVAAAAEKRLNDAHQRFLSSIKMLATVGKLLRPAPSALDLLATPLGETRVPDAVARRRSTVGAASGVAVVN